MCARYALSTDELHLAAFYEFSEIPRLQPRFNIAPTQPVGAVLIDPDSPGRGRQWRHFRWGLVPSWAKDPSISQRMINARSESAGEKPSFRHAFRRRRCLLPADGYYEWKKPAWKGDVKRPHFMHLTSLEPMAMAGLWEHWQDSEGNELETCTVLTMEPNALAAEVHDRMPVIMPRDRWADWLRPTELSVDEVVAMIQPLPADAMDMYEVSRRVNFVRNDDPSLAAPISDSERDASDGMDDDGQGLLF